MAARAMWKGVLNFGKTRLAVKLYAAIQDRAVRFHVLEKEKKARIQQRMIDPDSGEEVPREEVRMGLEIEPGSFVVLSKNELQELEPKASRDIEITRFVPAGQLGYQWYDRPYYLGPDADSADYFALAAALEESGREGIARWVMRKKLYFGALCSQGGYLQLISLRFAEEVLSAKELPSPAGRAASAQELRMAEQLVAAMEGDFQPREFRDEYRARVMDFIEKKAAGKHPRLAVVRAKKSTQSLTDQLARSLDAARRRKGKQVA